MQCPVCQVEVGRKSRFCNQCGAALFMVCPDCTYENEAGSKFCANCGIRLTSSAPASHAETPLRADTAERRHITVMFCDLVGSTAISRQLDPEDLRTILVDYYREVAAQVQRFGGFVARRVGDGVLIYFGYPAAHEDDPERAIRAGLALIASLRNLHPRPDMTLEARVAIESGLVVVDMISDGTAQSWTALGDTPNLAARLQTLADPGTVVIGPTAFRLAGAQFCCRDLGLHELKGVVRPIQVWQALCPVDSAASSFGPQVASTCLVGRAEELELLARRWEQAKTGEGRVVLISGEPGIGKSRLLRTFEDQLDGDPHATLSYHCSGLNQESALLPIMLQIEQTAKIALGDNAPTRLSKLQALLEHFSVDPRHDVTLLAELLGIDTDDRHPTARLTPAARMERTLAIFIAQLVWLSARHPLLMVVEDAHWIDASSHAAIQMVIERLQTLPILLLVTGRPEFQPQWLGQPHVTLLSLNRLSRRERVTMIEHLTAAAPLPEEVTRQIVELTDGVPLFVEELTKTVVEGGVQSLQSDAPGSTNRFDIPMTLQASLLTRLDRLGPAREIAQEAAAIGREFDYELLSAVTRVSETELVRGLERLVAAGLAQQRGVPPFASYSFKHALMQEAAYGTLVRTRREALHARIAEAYEQGSGEVIDNRPELLAHHLAEAGKVDRAIGFWLKAARIASGRGAPAEAVRQLHRGLALLDGIADASARRSQELELQTTLGAVLLAVQGYAGKDTGAAFARARELCQDGADPAQCIRVLWGEFTGHFVGGSQHAALPLGENLLALAEQSKDVGGRLIGHACLGSNLLHLGRFDEARKQFEQALAIDRAPGCEREWLHHYGQSGRVIALSYMALDLLVMDQTEAAQRMAEQAVKEAAGFAHPISLCFAHSIASRISYLLGDRKALSQHSSMVVRLAEEHGLALWRSLGSIYAGWNQAENGAINEGTAMIREGLSTYRDGGATLSLPLYLASLSIIEAWAGHHQVALDILDEAQAACETGGEEWIAAELQRLTGEAILALNGDAAAAAERFRSALALAKRQGAVLWEKRAAASLNALKQGSACKTT